MSFIGRNGFFGALKPANPHYARYALNPSYAKFVDKYSRGGGSENAVGTLGRAFAYRRPQFDDGGVAHMAAGGNPLALDNPMQYANPVTKLGPLEFNDIAAKGYGDAPDPSLIMMQNALKRAQGGNVTGNDVLPEYSEAPHNGPDNDVDSGHVAARGGSAAYHWGKVSPRFSNFGAEIEPHGRGDTTPRKRAEGGAIARNEARLSKSLPRVEPKESDGRFGLTKRRKVQ